MAGEDGGAVLTIEDLLTGCDGLRQCRKRVLYRSDIEAALLQVRDHL